MKKLLILLTVLFLSISAEAFENQLTAFCKRPASDEVFVCGDFNTLLVLDIKTGESIRTFNIGENLEDIQFSADGKNLIARNLEEIFFIDPDTGEIIKRMKISTPRIYPNSPYFADGDWYFKKTVSVYSTTDGSEVFKYNPGFNINSIGFNADFTELIVISSKIDIENESSLIQEKITNDGSYDLIRNTFIKQQSDNKGVKMDVIDLKTQKKILSTILPYSFRTSKISNISKNGTNFYIKASDIFVKVNSEGLATPVIIEGTRSSTNTRAIIDQQYLVADSWNGGYIYNYKTKNSKLIKNESNFELTNTVDIIEDENRIYFLSSDFLITEIDTSGNVNSQVTISNTTGNGFDVSCRIGYTDPEKREQEVSTINKFSKSKDFKVEDFDENKPVSIGNFKNIKAAEKFIQKLEKEGLESTLRIIPKA